VTSKRGDSFSFFSPLHWALGPEPMGQLFDSNVCES